MHCTHYTEMKEGQGPGTIVFCCTYPVPFPCSSPGPVKCEQAIRSLRAEAENSMYGTYLYYGSLAVQLSEFCSLTVEYMLIMVTLQ